MGLLDILNGLGGAPGTPSPQSAPSSQGTSPMAKALLALLAVYAAKHVQFQRPGSSAQPAPQPRMDPSPSAPGGGLGDILKGPLGGILGGTLGGAAAGSALNGGLGGLLKQLQQHGLGDAANSWVGTGPNQEVDEEDLSKALGADTINQVSAHSGLSRSDLLSQLSQGLPDFVDKLTPNGRLPTEQEAAHW